MTGTAPLSESLARPRYRSGHLDLRACADLLRHCAADPRLFPLGLQLHARLVLHSITSIPLLSSRLLSFYSRHARLDDARKVLDEIPHRDLPSYNALLAAYSRHGEALRCLRLFSSLARDPVLRPDAFSVSALLTSLSARIVPAATLREIHGYVLRSRLEGDPFVGNGLILRYSRFRELGYARKVFDEMPARDIVSWNSIISGCSQGGFSRECLEYYTRMESSSNRVRPNNITVVSVLHACSELRDFAFGVEVHQSFESNGILMDSMVWNSVIGFYAKCGELDHARKLFDEMPAKDEVTYGAMISGYMSHGLVEQAMELFRRMPDPALSTWNAVISGLAQNGCHMDGLNSLRGVWRAGLRANLVTLVSVLPSVSVFSSLLHGKEVHGYAVRSCLDRNGHVVASLIDMYSKAGLLNMAMKVFDGALMRCVIVWTSIISACAAHGDAGAAVALFHDMVAGGTRPDSVAFTAVLAACVHSGLVSEARSIFSSMVDEYGIDPTLENYACMVAALSRAGLFDEAVSFVLKMPVEPNVRAWGALLNGASVWGDARVGRIAFDHLVRMEPENTGNYAIMANIYSHVGEWLEASKIREKMKGEGLVKLPGCSWIEVVNGWEVFVAWDATKDFSDELYHMLGSLIGVMSGEGYVCSGELGEEKI